MQMLSRQAPYHHWMCHNWDGTVVMTRVLSSLDVVIAEMECWQGKSLIITRCVTAQMEMLSRLDVSQLRWNVVKTSTLSSLDVSLLRWNVGKARALSSLDVSPLWWKCCQGKHLIITRCVTAEMEMLSRQAPYHHWKCHCWDGNVVKTSTLSSLDVSPLRWKCCEGKSLIITGCVTAVIEMLSRQAPYPHWMWLRWDGNVVKKRALSSLDVALLRWKCCQDKHLIITECVTAEMEMLSRQAPYHHWMCHCWDGNVVKASTLSSLDVSPLRWKCSQNKHHSISGCVTADMEMLSKQEPYLIISDVSKAITAFHSTSEEEDRCLMNILFGFKFSSVPLL